MLQALKKKMQDVLTARYYRQYCDELKAQKNVYDSYIREKEEKLCKALEQKTCNLTVKVLDKQEFATEYEKWKQAREEILIIKSKDGILSPIAEKVIASYFEEHENCKLLYADEDVCVATEEEFRTFEQKGVRRSNRCCPNFKPVFSPETLLSYQYFGNIWAVRRSLCAEISAGKEPDARQFEYDFLLKAYEKVKEEEIHNLAEILFHKFVCREKNADGTLFDIEKMQRSLLEADAFAWGYEENYNKIKEDFLKRRGCRMQMLQEGGYGYPVYALPDEIPKISILIPSKNNPGVLEACISSIYERSTYSSFEIIVIDNGSSQENREKIEQLQKKYAFAYLYQPMEFNYSIMNNIAAKHASGDILLLLNDDMEVVTQDWLERMAGQLLQKKVGAVGARLLYPDTTLIQHVGVTNAVDGPVHKLWGKDDTHSYHNGRNKLVYNVIGVTGACLMVKKELFDSLGGLNEQLRVAYNDVDLCFSLYEMGFRNVIRNDVLLYHHESLSRGADAMSEEKMNRLKWERGYLYQRHPSLYGVDPYEGANNRGGSEFGVQLLPDCEGHKNSKYVISKTKFDYKRFPSGVHVGFDRMEKEVTTKDDCENAYIIQGYAILPEADNCRFYLELVFVGADTYRIPIRKQLRPNMSAGFPNASNLELSGFYCKVTQKDLPRGEYKLAIFASDRCSRQKLFQETGHTLVVE